MAVATIDVAAQQLFDAHEQGRPIAPLTETQPALGNDDAYAIQRGLLELHRAAGRRVIGRKVGMTNLELQAQLGIEEPNHGAVLDAFVLRSGETLSRAAAALIAPRLEVEIGFLLGERLAGPGVTPEAALAATASLVPAFEIVDCRVADWRLQMPDAIADNGAAWGAVLGDRERAPSGIDLPALGVVLERDGEVIATGAGVAVLGDPARSLAWLANALGAVGAALLPGELVLAGACAPPAEAVPGRYRASFGEELGAVELIVAE